MFDGKHLKLYLKNWLEIIYFLIVAKRCQKKINFIDLGFTNVISSSLSRGSLRVLIALSPSIGNVFRLS